MRSRAAAWCRNAFEVGGGIVGPLVVGLLGDHVSGPVGSIGDAMSLTIVALVPPTIFLALRHVPETMDEDLVALDRETAAGVEG